MMEGNNYIFLGGGDALVYLAGPMHKKYSTMFRAIHLVRTYLRINFSTSPPPPPCKHMNALRVTVTAVGLFQKILLNRIAHMY